jgi:hypothetical protein
MLSSPKQSNHKFSYSNCPPFYCVTRLCRKTWLDSLVTKCYSRNKHLTENTSCFS